MLLFTHRKPRRSSLCSKSRLGGLEKMEPRCVLSAVPLVAEPGPMLDVDFRLPPQEIASETMPVHDNVLPGNLSPDGREWEYMRPEPLELIAIRPPFDLLDPYDTGIHVEFTFTKNNIPVGTIDNGGVPQEPTFHEWENATGQFWLTVQDVPQEPFDLTWNFMEVAHWFGQPQLQAYLGSNSETQFREAINLDGSLRFIPAFFSGTLTRIDLSTLSGIQPGDRILVATFEFPRNLDDPAGISMAEEEGYPQPRRAHGVQLIPAEISGIPIYARGAASGKFVPVIYDLDDNGSVDIGDFVEFTRYIGQSVGSNSPGAYRADFDGNGEVGLSDFTLFIQHYGANKADGLHSISMPYFEKELWESAMASLATFDRASPSLEGEPNPMSARSLGSVPAPREEQPADEDVVETPSESEERPLIAVAESIDPRLLDAVLEAEYGPGEAVRRESENAWDAWSDWLL